MKGKIRDIIKTILKRFGYEVKRVRRGDLARRMKIVNSFNIDVLLDIGANAGQFAIQMRNLGYNNKIVSFEPVRKAFDELKINSSKDTNWLINNYALGNENSKSIINVSLNSVGSSILNMLPEHLNNAKGSIYVEQEEIEIKTLNSIFNSFCNKENSVMLKIDTQGYEKNVLEGAEECLKDIKIIQVEMSIVPLYENQILFIEMINYLDNKGFVLYSLENGFASPKTGKLLQVDGIFVNKTFANQN